MMKIFFAAVFVAVASALPMEICSNYQYLYDRCLPPTNWMCDKPLGYTSLDRHALKTELIKNGEYLKYVQTCAECMGTPDPYSEKVTYRKQPVCREVKTLVEYVNKTSVVQDIYGGNVVQEVCQVVLNSNDMNVQKVYRTECLNGDKKKSDNYCRFDYGTFKEYFCRPTNFVSRTMLVHCPSTGLQYYTEKVATACSCVRMKCIFGVN